MSLFDLDYWANATAEQEWPLLLVTQYDHSSTSRCHNNELVMLTRPVISSLNVRVAESETSPMLIGIHEAVMERTGVLAQWIITL